MSERLTLSSLHDILKACRRVERYIFDLTYNDFLVDEKHRMLLYAISKSLVKRPKICHLNCAKATPLCHGEIWRECAIG